MVPLFFFFFRGAACAAFAGALSIGISSSVGGADDSAESESVSDMLGVVGGGSKLHERRGTSSTARARRNRCMR